MKKNEAKIKIDRQRHEIDAANQVIGRLATRIAELLRGKHKPTYQPDRDNGDFVSVKNISQAKFTGNKISQKTYYRHSGYPGGLKEEKLEELFDKNPAEVLKKAVYNMLPKNKLRSSMMKRLSISK